MTTNVDIIKQYHYKILLIKPLKYCYKRSYSSTINLESFYSLVLIIVLLDKKICYRFYNDNKKVGCLCQLFNNFVDNKTLGTKMYNPKEESCLKQNIIIKT